MGTCSDGNGGGTKKYGFNGTSTIILVLVLLQLLLINLSPQDCFDDDNGGNGGDSGGDDACRDGGDIARTCENAFSTVGCTGDEWIGAIVLIPIVGDTGSQALRCNAFCNTNKYTQNLYQLQSSQYIQVFLSCR